MRQGREQISEDDVIPSDSVLVATLRLPGGKGGFGSMLRAIGKLKFFQYL